MTAPVSDRSVFLSWFRRGLGAFVQSVATDSTPGRGEVQLAVDLERIIVDGAPGAAVVRETATVSLPMFGEADVTGMDTRVVKRVWPQPDVTDAEQTGLPLVEFSEPDLPWRYTPEGPDPDGHLRPWICLIVLAEGEFTLLPSGEGRPLTEVEIQGAGVPLPSMSEAWAWAHVDLAWPDVSLAARRVDDLDLARLLQSHPHRAVSRLLAGRKLLARKRYTAMVVPTAARYWPSTPPESRRLPVYHHWSFSTGVEGNFRSLAQRIRSTTELVPEVGQRPVRVAVPRLSAVQGGLAVTEIQLRGALVPLGASPQAPAELLGGDNPQESLAGLLNRGLASVRSPTAHPLVVPPAYGSFAMGSAELAARLPSASSSWYDALNLDLHARMAAGVAAQVVQAQQQPLMASAWTQVDGIRAFQETLNFARASRAASQRLYRRDILTMPVESLLLVSEPVHAQVLSDGRTVAAILARSPIPAGVLDPAWRRLSRPRGALGRRQRRMFEPRLPLLERLNRGELRAADPPVRPPVAVARDFVSSDLRDEFVKAATPPNLPQQLAAVFEPILGEPQTSEDDLLRRIRQGPLDEETQQAVSEMVSAMSVPVAPAPTRTPADLPALAGLLRRTLDPKFTQALAMRSRLRLDARRARQDGPDPLAPILTWPEFPQPMVDPLRELSQEWILPGLDKIPNNRAALLQTNRPFLEAYLVGLNHEMSRELLWRGYPTDQRGTYFRRFWRHVSVTGDPPDNDIVPIHQWGRGPLGSHPARPSGDDNLVFLVRADLFQRYPSTALVLVRSPGPGEHVEYPSFVGAMKPDVVYAGFPFSANHVGDGTWFFAILEPLTETRFSYDWSRRAVDPAGSTYLRLGVDSVPAAPTDAAAVARSLLHLPVRVLVPAVEYLSPTPEEEPS